MMTNLLDAVAYRIGRWFQRFGVKRGIIAMLLGMGVVSAVVAAVGLWGLVRALMKVSGG